MLKKIKSERRVWLDITITLLALETMGYFYYGARTLVLSGICITVSLAAEFASKRLMHKKFTADDLSCTSDALIIALMMPAAIDYKIPAIACVFAVVAAKNIFGGRKNMIFSPAAAAYVFMLTSWHNKLLSYPAPHEKIGVFENADNLMNSASYTFNHTGNMNCTDFELLLGNFSGPIGAVSILLLIVSAVILLFRHDISAGAFFGTLFGTAFMAFICPVAWNDILSVKYVFSTNMVLFAAVYIISDVRIAPKANYYAFFYGLFIALFSYVIMITTGRENIIVIMSVIFTPIVLGMKTLNEKIDNERLIEKKIFEERLRARRKAVRASVESSAEEAEKTSAEEKTIDANNASENDLSDSEPVTGAAADLTEGDESREQAE